MHLNSYSFKVSGSLKIILLCIFWVSFLTGANSQNALSFDGLDDYVAVPSASSKIANSSQVSLSAWAYLTNSSPVYPNYDGIAGFRNNSDADFYFLQLTSTNVEARFRNSMGTNYDITYTGLTLNTWHHFVLTYDGSKLRFYDNGVIKDSLTASGTISNTAAELNIGKLIWNSTDFLLTGKVDEVGLWNKKLTSTEISNIYTCGINSSDPNLQLYYNFDQGVAGGTNTGLTTLIDSKGNINGTLYNFTLSGTTSNWVNGFAFPGSYLQTANICNGDSVFFGNQYLKTSGTYTYNFPASGPCDSIVVLTLNVHNADYFTTNQDICEGDSLTWQGGTYKTTGQYFANYTSIYGCDSTYELNLAVHQKPGPFLISGVNSVTQYQVEWYTVPANASLVYTWNVNNGQILSQPTNDSALIQWHVTGPGSITVNVADNFGCKGDSSVFNVTIGNIGLNEQLNDNALHIYPNPSPDKIIIETNQYIVSVLYDLEGRELIQTSGNELNIQDLCRGIYILQVKNSKGELIALKKIVKK